MQPENNEAIQKLYDQCAREMVESLTIKAKAKAKISSLLIHQLALHCSRIGDVHGGQWHHFHTHKILDAISEVEGLSQSFSTKKETQFKRLPLAEFHHKHFSSPAFLNRNLLNVNKGQWNEIWARFEERRTAAGLENEVSLDKLIGLIIQSSILDGLDIRNQKDPDGYPAITGEWIVFRNSPEGNSYLTLATHNESDEIIYSRAIEAEKETFQIAALKSLFEVGESNRSPDGA